jgi:hypothetical protein
MRVHVVVLPLALLTPSGVVALINRWLEAAKQRLLASMVPAPGTRPEWKQETKIFRDNPINNSFYEGPPCEQDRTD